MMKKSVKEKNKTSTADDTRLKRYLDDVDSSFASVQKVLNEIDSDDENLEDYIIECMRLNDSIVRYLNEIYKKGKINA